MLRTKIQKLIEKSENAELAAKRICLMLDESLELYENGWFDDDSDMNDLFENPSSKNKYRQLFNQIDQLLADD